MDGDAASAIAILDWADAHGRALASVKVGGCEVVFFEAPADGKKREQPRRPEGGVYQTFGGEVWRHAVRDGQIDPAGHGASDGEDLEPAVGSGA